MFVCNTMIIETILSWISSKVDGSIANDIKHLLFVLAQSLPMDREDVANPYVKMYLRPPIDQKLRQTSVQHQTINPVWDEYFKFGVTNEIIMKSAKTLHFYIYNYAHSSRPECIGEAQIRLTPQTMRGCDLWCAINKQRAVRATFLSFSLSRSSGISSPLVLEK